MANKFSKDKIDFDVYERQDPASRVDWGKAASDITETFAGIRDERQGRKDVLEKNITDQQTALNEIGEYDSPTLRQVALDSSQQSADELNRKADLMRRGLLKPNDMMKFKSNQSAGWTQFKVNAEQWDAKFQDFTLRTKDGQNAGAERELAEMVSTFGNLKNMKFLTDDDGNMAYARTEDDGSIIPGESVSANEMTNLLNQKINSYNATDSAKAMGDKIGVIVRATIDPHGVRTNIETEEMSRAESAYFSTEESAEVLLNFAKEMTADPRDLAVMMVDSDLTAVNGVTYENNFVGGPSKGEDKHAKWEAENPESDQSRNPYIKWEWNGNAYEPVVSEAQKTAGDQYASDLIKGTLNITEDKTAVKIQATEYQDSPTTVASNKEQKNNFGYLQSVNKIMDGDQTEFQAALTDLQEQWATNFPNKSPIEDIVRGGVDDLNFIVMYADGTEKKVAKYKMDSNGEPIMTESEATAEDVANGLAKKVGETISKRTPTSKRERAEGMVSLITPVKGSSFSGLYDEFEESEGGFEDLGGADETVKYDKPFKSVGTTNFDTKVISADGKKLTDLFKDASNLEDSSGQIKAYESAASQGLGSALKGITDDYQISFTDEWWSSTNTMNITINGVEHNISFKLSDPQKLSQEINKIVNDVRANYDETKGGRENKKISWEDWKKANPKGKFNEWKNLK